MRDRLQFDIRYDGSRFGYFTPPGPVRCPFCDLRRAGVSIFVDSGEAVDTYGDISGKTRTPEMLEDR